MAKNKKKGTIAQMMESSRSDKVRFTQAVTEGKDYPNLYDIGSAIKRIDSSNLMVGVIAVMIGLMMFMLSVIWPFLMGKGFHLGLLSALGMMVFLSGLFYYIGSFRILHPLSTAVAVKRDLVIRDILRTREVIYDDEREEETQSDNDP